MENLETINEEITNTEDMIEFNNYLKFRMLFK